MLSLMDDFCGHMAFVDKPWLWVTVQVNVSLKNLVKLGSVLQIHGRIQKKEGRKVHVEAVLDDGAEKEAVTTPRSQGKTESLFCIWKKQISTASQLCSYCLQALNEWTAVNT